MPGAAAPYPAVDVSPTAPSEALRCARFAQRLLAARPALADEVEQAALSPWRAEAMREFLDARAPSHETQLAAALRELRSRVLLRTAARDLAGLAPLDEVVATMSDLAEIALQTALRFHCVRLEANHGAPTGSSGAPSLLILGMGKLGGAELNVSSDIDLVFVYPEEGETTGPRSISNHEYFTRLGRALIATLSEITADGHVFRVDMRLRPYGDGGPLVSSFEMLENYFITQGREWECYAWIKARALTGDRGAELDDLVRPFVYRRHLDYATLAGLRELHRQVRSEVERRDIADNIKLGPGGIREIEFIAQVFQLIRGGREPELRARPTLAVLPVLAQKNLLPAASVAELTRAYGFLRALEHRLQYLDDQQTHDVPRSEADRALIAEAMECKSYAALADALAAQRAAVTRYFQDIFAASPEGGHALAHLWADGADTQKSIGALAALGFRQPQDVEQRLRSLRGGGRYREMPAASQAQLDRLVPLAIAAAASGENPDAALERLLDLLEAVSRRGAYLALLVEYPHVLSRLAEMMSASPWAAQYLTAQPILLDELLDARALYEVPHWPGAAHQLRSQMDAAAGATERQMDILRHFKHSQTMRLLAQDLAGLLPLETLSDHLSDLACVVLQEILRVTWPAQAHVASPRFTVIAYGKLGGKELGYASDLDLV